MKARCLILIVITLSLTSCFGLDSLNDTQTVQTNDNAEFYGTEWSTSDKKEGLKFYKDDTVLEFAQGFRGTGTFKYYKDSKWISFDGLETFFTTYTTVTTSAFVLEDGSLKVIWHKLGEETNYYEIMYKRR